MYLLLVSGFIFRYVPFLFLGGACGLFALVVRVRTDEPLKAFKDPGL